MNQNYDFCGWASRNNMLCSDGRTIDRDAFKGNDGQTVPLVWNHQHNDPNNVLGHALLENRPEGVFAYCAFNDTESGVTARKLVDHGDVKGMSIYANKLKHTNGRHVIHGDIREVSLVLAGANPGAFITSVIQHSDGSYGDSEDEMIVSFGDEISLEHAEEGGAKMAENEQPTTGGKTVKEIYNTLNEDQKKLMEILVSEALNDQEDEEYEEDNTAMHNVFDNDAREHDNVLSHSDMEEIIADGKRFGSLRDSFLAHTQDYGITDIGNLFPDAQAINKVPEFYKRDTDWVAKVMNGVHHTPFSRVKSTYADITADAARAKGYIKGKIKKEEVIAALKRTTDPTTIYKKQKLDRDDILDITDFDVVAWIKGELRIMLEEEIARAILIGDGRSSDSDDKINPLNIRPIWTDNEVYTIAKTVEVGATMTTDQKCKAIIRAAVKSRKDYKGTGNPTFFTTEDVLTDMLLMEDGFGHPLYDTVEKLATALRVNQIVTVPVMEGQYRTVEGVRHDLIGIIVNLADYNVGADKGGAVSMFDDFDIDYNQQKYLMETRCSGAMVRPKAAIVLETVPAAVVEDDPEGGDDDEDEEEENLVT